jgi:hypothetical protein
MADRLGQIAKEVPGSGPEIDNRHAGPALEELDDLLGLLPLVSFRLIEVIGVGLEFGTTALRAGGVLVSRRGGSRAGLILSRSSVARGAQGCHKRE